jgi:hypothetical protein
MKYRYSGPTSGVTLQKGADDPDAQEVMLHTGADVELPETHEYINTLVALGYLVPVTKTGNNEPEPAAKGA